MCEAGDRERIAGVISRELMDAQRIIERQRTEIIQLRDELGGLRQESDRRNEVLGGWIGRANYSESLVAQMRAVLA